MHDVREAVQLGYPAGCIHPGDYIDDDDDPELRLAFDFDGIIADDSAETIYQQKGGGLKSFHEHETLNAAEPLPAGPLQRFFKEISKLQRIDIEKNLSDPDYKQKIRIAIATARNAPAHKRVITTLRELNILIDEAFFLGGINKNNVLNVFKPHIFFDQINHIKDVSQQWPSVHVPFGIANKLKLNDN